MKINKNDLLEALEIVKPGLATAESIEQTASFAFLEDRVVTFNDSVSVSHPVKDMNLKGAIRAEELYNLLSKIKSDEILVVQTENELRLKSGTSKAGIRLQSEIKLPLDEIDDNKDWQDLPEEFASNLNFIKDSASKDMSRRVLTCVHVNEIFMEASDSFQIMRVYMNPDDPFPFPGVLIPAEFVGEIGKINPTQVAEGNRWIHFKNPDGTELSTRILEDTYPDTEDHLQVEGEKMIFPKKMPEILDKVMVFTKQDHLMDEEMQVRLKNNTLMVYGKNDYGWFREKAKVKYEGEEASFWITPHLLKNILERSNQCYLGKEKIKFEDKNKNWEYVAILRGD